MKRNAWKAARGSAGFTLVELVVVIAILGILAGVGTVGYSGYIQRANEAVDETMYHDIVYAGEIGRYTNPGVQGRVTVTESGASVSSTTSGNAAILTQWMENAFGDNWADTVKYKTDKYLNNDNYSNFILPLPEGVDLDDVELGYVEDYQNSNFAGSEAELLDKIDQLTDALGNKTSDGLIDKIAAVEALTGNKAFSEYLTGLGLDLSNPDDATAIGNAAVQYIAQQAGNMSAEDALASMDKLLEIKDALTGQGGSVDPSEFAGMDVISSAAIAYGIATGYLNSDQATEEERQAAAAINVDGLTGLMNYIGIASESPNFDAYYESEGSQDVDGYLGMMNLINKYGDKIDITIDGAYNSDSTLAMLQGILNGK